MVLLAMLWRLKHDKIDSGEFRVIFMFSVSLFHRVEAHVFAKQAHLNTHIAQKPRTGKKEPAQFFSNSTKPHSEEAVKFSVLE